ncbi:MAG: hypothetical protein JWR40_3073 [Massilia sp.]|jgi:hypothetical protein|nr:hypothetical protein [Massilia sp.]MDB5950853.1 hypothetical protein [Massilia sp.]
MNYLARLALPIVTLAALLAACGGGGGGGAAPPPVIAPGPVVTGGVDIGAAWRDYLSVAHTWTMRGQTSDSRAFELSVVMKPGANRSFTLTGASGQTIDQSIRFAIAGANTVSSDGTLFFNGAAIVGVSTTNGACFGLRGTMPTLPGASAVGSNGPMFVLDGNAGCSTGGQKLGATTYNWSVENDGGLTMFCLTTRQENASAAFIGSDAYCFEASAGGTLGTKAKFTITRPDGTTTTGRNF